ncbi:phosphotransferase [Microlunatus sp. GCM10028923]|uniref:phosphotransferase n=1 Tax=Microlunatus sp. GCM10028923 TaxID=3273400 RepID=UPI003619B25C
MPDLDPGPFLAANLGARSGTASRVRRGAIGAVWRLDLTGHRHRTLAAKEFIAYVPDEGDVANELALQAAAADAGVPSPEAVGFADGYVAVDPRTGRGWRTYAWIDGRPAADDEATRRWLIRQVAAIHRLGRTEPEPPLHSFSLTVDADWPALVAATYRAGLPWAERFERVVEERVPGLAWLVGSRPKEAPIWSHRDAQPANVMVTADGRRLLVDWDNAGGTWDRRELGSQLAPLLDDRDQLRSAYDLYREAGGTARITGPDAFASSVAATLNFLAEQVGRLTDPAASEDDRDYAGGWLPGLLDDLPDLELLTEAAGLLSDRG